jgi:hypothetical protein
MAEVLAEGGFVCGKIALIGAEQEKRETPIF